MSIMVRDILNIGLFNNANILAGKDGFSNEVKSVSIADCPISEVDSVVSRPGDFYLSSFYFAKNSIEDMYEFMNDLIISKGSAVCLINEYIDDIPNDIKLFCDEHNFPVIMVDRYIPYSEIITEIMNLIIIDQRDTLLESKIDSLISGLLAEYQRVKFIRDINPHFQNYMTAIYCKPLTNSLKPIASLFNTLNKSIFTSAMSYKSGILIILSYKESPSIDIEEKVNYIIEKLKDYFEDCTVGISNHNHNILNMGTAIREAMTATISRALKASDIIHYSDLGIIKLLMIFNGHEELDSFYKDIIVPIKEFDQKNKGASLLQTIESFFDNGKDYKRTAQSMFLHENTVRYRISKALELVSKKDTNVDLMEDLSIGIKIHKLKKAIND